MNNIIKVLMIEPCKHPVISYLDASLSALRNAVNINAVDEGDVKARRISKHIYILYNNAGSLSGLEANRKVGKDIISGTFYIVAVDKEYFPVSLTDKEADKYLKRFWNPESFDDTDVIKSSIHSFFEDIMKYA